MTEMVGARSGKLTGKTVAVKDNMHIAGVPMAFGSNFMRGFVSSCTATVVSRILDAGHTFIWSYYAVILIDRTMGLARPSVRLSVRPSVPYGKKKAQKKKQN